MFEESTSRRSLTAVALEFCVGMSTVSDVKRDRQRLKKFGSESADSICLKKRCIVRRANDEDMTVSCMSGLHVFHAQ